MSSDKASALAGMLRVGEFTMDDLLRAAEQAGLEDAPVNRGEGLTVAQFYDTVRQAALHANGDEDRGGGTFRTYEPYFRLFVEGYPYARREQTRGGRPTGDQSPPAQVPAEEKLFAGCGHMRLADVRFSDIDEAAKWAFRRARLDHEWKNWRREDQGRRPREHDQSGARTSFHNAVRFFFAQAVKNNLLSASADPTDHLTRPARSDGSRRAFTEPELVELHRVAATTGNDPELARLLVDTVLVTGARREGLLNLNLGRLNPARCTVFLHEKGDKGCEQPITAELLRRLTEFAHSRGASRFDDPVFCQRPKSGQTRPVRITNRCIDSVNNRLQKHVPWADDLGVTLHWFRHHAVTQVQRIAGDAVAARFARHSVSGVTLKYSKASGEEVCQAMSIMTGWVHPLARGGW